MKLSYEFHDIPPWNFNCISVVKTRKRKLEIVKLNFIYNAAGISLGKFIVFFQNLRASIIFYQNCDHLQHLLLIEFPLLQSSWRQAHEYSDARFTHKRRWNPSVCVATKHEPINVPRTLWCLQVMCLRNPEYLATLAYANCVIWDTNWPSR